MTDEIEQLGVDDDFEPVPGAEALPADVPNGTIDEAGDLPAG